ATVPLRGVTLRDPEDIAVGPCAAGSEQSCIYLGDIGDNGSRRKSVQVLKVAEPERLEDAALVPAILPFRYPDGPHDAQAMAVARGTGRVFVTRRSLFPRGDVSRMEGPGSRGGGQGVRVRTLRGPREFDSTTPAADAPPGGTRLLLRTYPRAWELRSPDARA